jgi:hypothetical protein
MDPNAMGGLIGGIIGGVGGLAGGAIGTYFSIKNTNGPKERQFMVRCAVYMWLGISVFLGLLFLLPNPYRWLLFIPYGVALPFAIIKVNKTQARIRAEEAGDGPDAP